MDIKAYVEDFKRQYYALNDKQKYYFIGGLVGSFIFIAILFLLKLAILAILLIVLAVLVLINYQRLRNIRSGEAYYEDLKSRDLYKKAKVTVKDIVKASKYDIYNKLNIHDKSQYDQYFEAQMRVNGEMYFAKGKVQEIINLRNGLYRAVVYGREKYTVEIRFDQNDEIEHMNCTCPGFSQNMACKHAYATVYALKCSGNMRVLINEINCNIETTEGLIDESEVMITKLYSKSPNYNEYMKNIKAYSNKLMELKEGISGKNENGLLNDVIMSIKILEGFRKYVMSLVSDVRLTSTQNKLFLPKFELIISKIFKQEEDPYKNTLSRIYVENNEETPASNSVSSAGQVSNTSESNDVSSTNTASATNPSGGVAAAPTQNVEALINRKQTINKSVTEKQTAKPAEAANNFVPVTHISDTKTNTNVVENNNEVGPRVTPTVNPQARTSVASNPVPGRPIPGDMASNPNSHLMEDEDAFNSLFKEGEKEAKVQFDDYEINVKKNKKTL